MSGRWQRYSEPESAAEACARYTAGLLDEAVSRQGRATFAISGGSTPKLLFERLASREVRWDRVHFFWVDERPVPPDDPQSNYRLAREHLLLPARVPPQNVHRIEGERPPEEAAQRYVEEIRDFFRLGSAELPRFDVVQCGLGVDGHTASLFPGSPLLEDRDRIAAAVYAETPRQWRVTLLPGALLAAGHTVFLVTGEDKARAVRNTFNEPYNPRRYPAQIASGDDVVWFLDQAAAGLLETPTDRDARQER
ncbi:MAG TPA: 6-phosphogluconolactonase [Bryobacteraceae bacterium]|nr:6-phosphogluconolactonase [Bryobacteraceae bacterium]